jgi:hypothetical protein
MSGLRPEWQTRQRTTYHRFGEVPEAKFRAAPNGSWGPLRIRFGHA